MPKFFVLLLIIWQNAFLLCKIAFGLKLFNQLGSTLKTADRFFPPLFFAAPSWPIEVIKEQTNKENKKVPFVPKGLFVICKYCYKERTHLWVVGWGQGVGERGLPLLQLSVPLVTSNVLNKLLTASASNATSFISCFIFGRIIL